jgi:hypothetical protein
MVDVAEVLNAVGIPWPDADTGKARQAGQDWKGLGMAAQAALDQGNNAANVLCANNTGQAMAAFSQYWDEFGGTGKTANLEVLVGCCNAMSEACDNFADAVDKAKSDLEEKAAEIGAAIGGGIALTLFTAGMSDAAASGVVAAIVPEAWAAVSLLGTTVGEIASTILGGAMLGFADTAMEQVTKNLVQLGFGEKVTGPDWSEIGQGVAIGSVAGFLGKTVVGAASGATASASSSVSDDVAVLAPKLPGMVNAIPDAVNTPAGKALIDLSSKVTAQDAVTAAQGKPIDAPSVQTIIGELLDSKIEAAADSDD